MIADEAKPLIGLDIDAALCSGSTSNDEPDQYARSTWLDCRNVCSEQNNVRQLESGQPRKKVRLIVSVSAIELRPDERSQ